jgi:hypothetical protein
VGLLREAKEQLQAAGVEIGTTTDVAVDGRLAVLDAEPAD